MSFQVSAVAGGCGAEVGNVYVSAMPEEEVERFLRVVRWAKGKITCSASAGTHTHVATHPAVEQLPGGGPRGRPCGAVWDFEAGPPQGRPLRSPVPRCVLHPGNRSCGCGKIEMVAEVPKHLRSASRA